MTRYPIELSRDQYSAILEGRQHIAFLDNTDVGNDISNQDVLTLLEVEDGPEEEERTGYFFHVDIISVFDNMRIHTPYLRERHCYIASVKLKTGRRIQLPAYDLISWEKTTGIKYIKPAWKEIK